MAANGFGPTFADMIADYLAGQTVKAMLVGSGYAPNKDDDFRSDAVAAELAGTGYTAGGITLANVAVTYDAANDRVKIDADDAAFGTVTLAGITGIIPYISTGSAATDRILSAHTFASQSPSGVPFTYQWHADGVAYVNL